jgi:hypothetical protein
LTNDDNGAEERGDDGDGDETEGFNRSNNHIFANIKPQQTFSRHLFS